MEKKTLGSEYRALREGKGLTMQQVADACGVHQATVCNIERGRPVRWESVHLTLTISLGIGPASPKYRELNRLWLEHRGTMAESLAADHAKIKISRHAADATKKFRNLVRDLDPDQTAKVLRAAKREAAKHDA